MNSLRSAFGVIQRHRRAYVVLNIVFYVLVVCGMIYAAVNPAVQEDLLRTARSGFSKGMLAVVARAYRDGNVLMAMGLTFAVNLVLGAFSSITLPSLVVPFSGLMVGGGRALVWGLMLSPANPELRPGMVVHSLTLVLEGQAYVLTMLASYVQGKAFLRPRSVGAERHGAGYRVGLKDSGRLYLLVVLVLAVAAAYEAVEVIYFIPSLVVGP